MAGRLRVTWTTKSELLFCKSPRPLRERGTGHSRSNGYTSRSKEVPSDVRSVFLDKVVQQACKNILEAIYEPVFLDCSYGYRPNQDAHKALKAVNHLVMQPQKKTNWIVDADIKGFFDNIDHHTLMK